MPAYGFSIRIVMNGGSEITPSDVYLARQTIGRVFNRRRASAIVLAPLNSSIIAYLRIEQIDLADTIPMPKAVR